MKSYRFMSQKKTAELSIVKIGFVLKMAENFF